MGDCPLVKLNIGNATTSACRKFEHFLLGFDGDALPLLSFLQGCRRNRYLAASHVKNCESEVKKQLVVPVEKSQVDDIQQIIDSTVKQYNLPNQSDAIEFLLLGCGIEWQSGTTMKIFSKQGDAMLEKLNQCRKDNLFCDLSICIGDESIHPIHRCVLAVASPYLMDIFQTNANVIKIDSVTQSAIFEEVLEFVYTGAVTISAKNVEQLLGIAENLQIASLRKACEDYYKLTPHVEKENSDGDAAAETLLTKSPTDNVQLLENALDCHQQTLIIHTGAGEGILKDSEEQDFCIQNADDLFKESSNEQLRDPAEDPLSIGFGEKLYPSLTCAYCSDIFESQEDLTRHFESCYRETANPTVPEGNARKPKKRKTDSVSRRFCCGTCRSWFRTRSHLKRHMISHTGERKHCCTTCGKLFLKADHLTRHESTHSSERPFPCNKCDKKFKNKHNMQRHQQAHSSERPFFCELCAKRFKDRSGLLIHQKSHDESERVCPFCGKCFKQRNRLEYHILRHENPPSCTICSKRFTFETQLRKHMMSHSGVRPFNCETCGKQFSNAHGMKLHQKKHTGIGLYACTLCDRKFLDNYHLQRHLKTHTGEKPFKCDVCNRAFSRVDNCVNHQRACEVKQAMRRNIQSFTENKGEKLKIKRVKQISPPARKLNRGFEASSQNEETVSLDIALAVKADDVVNSRYRKIAKKLPDLSLVILKSSLASVGDCGGTLTTVGAGTASSIPNNQNQEADISFGLGTLADSETLSLDPKLLCQ